MWVKVEGDCSKIRRLNKKRDIGHWSDPSHERMEEVGIRGEMRTGPLRKTLSSLAMIWAEPDLLLEQVKLSFVELMSKRYQEEEKSSISSLQGSQTKFPLIFYFLHKVVLNSPFIIRFEPLTSSKRDKR